MGMGEKTPGKAWKEIREGRTDTIVGKVVGGLNDEKLEPEDVDSSVREGDNSIVDSGSEDNLEKT